MFIYKYLLRLCEIQIKTTARYHFTPSKMTEIKKSDSKCWQKCREIGAPIHCW